MENWLVGAIRSDPFEKRKCGKTTNSIKTMTLCERSTLLKKVELKMDVKKGL